jgi:hypothetical protein
MNGQIPADVAQCIRVRLDHLHESITQAYEATERGDLTGLTILIRDMGWFIFAIDQHRQRIPKGQGNASLRQQWLTGHQDEPRGDRPGVDPEKENEA